MTLLQRYAYANDNPANLVDPSGMSPESDRFHQLMAAEEQVQAWAKQILSDPCWKTHAFCAHVALVWKKFKEYAHECAAGAVGGAIVGGIAGLPGGVYGVAAGAGYGAMWGCLGGIAAHAADNTFGVSQNLAAQCLIGGVTATLTVVSASHGGVGGQPSRVGWGSAGGCLGGVFGWIARDVLAYAGADSGAQGVGQCGMFAGATLFGGLAVGGAQGDTIRGAVGSCAGSILGGRVVP
jgi:hypothetical protein